MRVICQRCQLQRNEAILYAGKPDPDVDLSPYSNSWLSYGAITARKLGDVGIFLLEAGDQPLALLGVLLGSEERNGEGALPSAGDVAGALEERAAWARLGL